MHKKHLKRLFPHFSTRGHGPMDQRTDKASYNRVACPQLKIAVTEDKSLMESGQCLHDFFFLTAIAAITGNNDFQAFS